MTLRLFVAGASGQVALSLKEKTVEAGIEAAVVGRPDIDLTNPDSLDAAIRAYKPTIVINAGAYTAVDQAESEAAAAFAINADGAGALATAAAGVRAPILHLSTDYVFDGSKPVDAAYDESDPVAPLGVYGRSKLEGERLVAANNPQHVILRTAWVYSPFGKNFVKTMLRVAETRDELNVVADQTGNPTSALDIADALIAVARRLEATAAQQYQKWGVYHLAGSGRAVWADLAEATFEASAAAGGPTARVNRISTEEYPTPAKRPVNSQLNGAKLTADYGVVMPCWRESAAGVVRRLLS